MFKKIKSFVLVSILASIVLTACGATPNYDASLTAVAADGTEIAKSDDATAKAQKPTATTEQLSATSPIGSVKLEQGTLVGSPGDEWADVLTLDTTGADQFTFPGYICSTSEDPHGIGEVTTGSGGLNPNSSTTYGIKIWNTSKSGENCDGTVKIWLYKDGQKYILEIPIKIVVQ